MSEPRSEAAPGAGAEPQPEAELVIGSLETVKIVSDPLRLSLIDLLRGSPRTVRELAAALRLGPKKLYYHIKLLEEHGLIRVTGTRLVSGITEKRYQATAYVFVFAPELFTAGPGDAADRLESAATLTFNATREDLRRSLRAGLIDLADDAPVVRSLFSGWGLASLTAAQAERVYALARQLAAEFECGAAAETRRPEVQTYRLLVTIFPDTHRLHGVPATES